ncbi:MAG TPA: hypothetical protein DCZ01_08525 [Elusimicrobia bacterium]|nr:MAG: hypothetical protein A2X37_03725 [Elusimicrobia bacterium GWA2_66_18]OGR68308.1 MAG: hypothetical protein A2X40_00050 [Elusimicrobia bacterium GWC2_65_9]HAZ08547.1 hypothetical protein [Elusimicrobiota bacterium]
MRRLTSLLCAAAAFCACVSVVPLPDPRGAVGSKQRLVVLVAQSPGPWIIKESDSKAEAAAKLLPVGFLVQTVQDDKTLDISKELQQYLPRPRYDRQLEASMLKTLKTLHGGDIQTMSEAGVSAPQIRDWNQAKDQLDWRRRYFAPEMGQSVPRDYSQVPLLDDGVIVEVNLSFGTETTDEGQIMPALTAATRVYRADTARLLWSREEMLTDKTSSMTLAEFKLFPSELTRRLEALAPPLGETVARSAAKALALTPPESAPPAPSVPASTGTLPSGPTQTDLSTAAPAGVVLSTTTLPIIAVSTDASSPPR